MINWITSFYLTNNIERQREVDKCLQKNIENSLIKKIYLFVDDKKAYKYLINNFNIDKIKYYILNRLTLYSDYFKCANTYCKNEICMISNNDLCIRLECLGTVTCESNSVSQVRCKLFNVITPASLQYRKRSKHKHTTCTPLFVCIQHTSSLTSTRV